MADTITRRLVNKVQTEGAAAAERDFAKVEQAGAKAGAGIAGGMDKASAASEKASSSISSAAGKLEGKLDGLGKAFSVTDKMGEVLGKVSGAFGLVTAAAGLAYGAFELIRGAMEASEPVIDQATKKWGELRQSIGGAADMLGEYAALADPRTLARLTQLKDVISGVNLPAWQQTEELQARVLSLQEAVTRARNVAPVLAGVAPGGPVLQAAEARLAAAEQMLRDRQEDIAAAMAESKALVADAKALWEGDGDGDGVEHGGKRAGGAKASRAAVVVKELSDLQIVMQALEQPIADAIGLGEAENSGVIDAITSLYGRLREEAALAAEEVGDLYDEIAARSAEALASTRAMAEGFGSAAEALSSVALSAALSGDSIVEAVGKSMAASALDYAAKAIGFGAQGLFLLAFGDAAGAAAAGTAAVQAAAAAAAFGAGAAALGGFSGGGGGGGGGEAPSTESLTGRRETERGGGGVTVNVNFSGQPLITDRAITEAIGRGVSEASRTRGNAIYGRLN